MDSGYYAACTGLRAQNQALELIANNLANVSTIGYRGQNAAFQSLLSGQPAGVSEINYAINDFNVMDKSTLDLTAGSTQHSGNPLVHLIRNSLDHGLESPAVRLAAGKKSQGCIRLEAHPEGDQIVISVSDDGAGIDPSRILSKAIEKGFVASDRARLLSKKEILDFIFLPGFSTAETVNDLSGRGVGMDVVRSNLKRMNGSIEIDSTPGKGTTVLLHLPLTLAILPVLLVQVAGDVYGLPMRSVIETSQMRPRDVHQVEGREVLQLRGLTFPLLRLAAMFDSQPDASARSEKVVILSVGEKRLALAVDHLIGQESTVIKPLGSYLHNCAGIAGATIGGDGRVRLVLDPAGLVAHAGAPAAFEAVR
jgi:two-component system chemotaxis sensor kinase CheA